MGTQKALILILASALLITSVYAQKGRSVIFTPAPAPAPEYVNLTQMLTFDGPFQTFLNYLESTKVLETFQNQANNSLDGITIFVPKDSAFSSLKNPSVTNLTSDQLKSLLLFHALPHFYTLSDFKNLSLSSPAVTTLAGGSYTLKLTDVAGTVIVNSGWSNTTISSAVHSSYPVSVFQVDKVLLPVAIYGTNIPPPPPPSPAAPAPVPTPAATADAPAASSNATKPKSTSTPSASSGRVRSFGVFCYIVLAFGGVVFMTL